LGGGTPGLIAAINTANGSGGGTINLAPDCTCLLTQVDNTVPDLDGPSSNGLPVITSPISLNGSFATIERFGEAVPFRILFVSDTGGLTIAGGRIANNNGGGGISNRGHLTLNKVASRATSPAPTGVAAS
jgi:hypothetical protein